MPFSFLGGTEGSCFYAGASDELDRRTAFEELYDRTSRELWALAYGTRSDSDVAVGCVRQAFLDLWNEGRDGNDDALPWLRARVRQLAAAAPTQNGITHPMEHEDKNGDLAQIAALRGQLAELNERERTLLTLRYALDYDAAQIAMVLGENPTTVHMELSALRRRIGQSISEIMQD